MSDHWEAPDDQAEAARREWEGEDWRESRELNSDEVAPLIADMRKALTAAVGPAFDLASSVAADDRKALNCIHTAAAKAVEDLGLREDAAYLPDLLPRIVAVVVAARKHGRVCGGHSSEHARTAKAVYEAVDALAALAAGNVAPDAGLP
mgnify:CR=1 FL=1